MIIFLRRKRNAYAVSSAHKEFELKPSGVAALTLSDDSKPTSKEEGKGNHFFH